MFILNLPLPLLAFTLVVCYGSTLGKKGASTLLVLGACLNNVLAFLLLYSYTLLSNNYYSILYSWITIDVLSVN
jgi:hypothetical protein